MCIFKPFLFGAFLSIFAGTAMADHKLQIHIPAEPRGVGSVPECHATTVLRKIEKRFDWVQKHYEESNLRSVNIERPRQTGFHTNERALTDQRFCAAHIRLSDGTHPTVYYVVEERAGFASLGWNVEYCVKGHDNLKAYGRNCRAIRHAH